MFRSIRKRERDVLAFCRGRKTSKDALGRFFEELVIARFVADGRSPDDFRRILAVTNITIDEDWEAKLRKPTEKIQLGDTAFPEGTYSLDYAAYFIPIKSNFPAADLIIRVRRIVIGIQIHTSSKNHRVVLSTLNNSTEKAQWNKEQVERIILVYLSPKVATKQQMEKTTGRESTSSEEDWVVMHCCTIEDFDSLRNLQWDS